MKGSRREEVEARTVCTGVRENVSTKSLTFRTLKADGSMDCEYPSEEKRVHRRKIHRDF